MNIECLRTKGFPRAISGVRPLLNIAPFLPPDDAVRFLYKDKKAREIGDAEYSATAESYSSSQSSSRSHVGRCKSYFFFLSRSLSGEVSM